MNYEKTVWKNGSSPALNETNLNKIEQGIKDAHEKVDGHSADDAIHKTSQQIRGEVTTPLRTEVVSSLPTSPQKGQLLFNEATGKFTGYDGGKWL